MLNKVIVDETLRATLPDLGEQWVLHDEAGHVVGHYLPADAYHDLIIDWSRLYINDEELEAARRQTGGRTLAEIWASLGQA